MLLHQQISQVIQGIKKITDLLVLSFTDSTVLDQSAVPSGRD